MLRIVLPLILLTLGCTRASGSLPEAVDAQEAGDAWVESTLARLTLREKVGQMVFPFVTGEYLAVGSEAYDRLRDWVVERRVGGLIISIGPPLEVAAKLNLLQQLADVPLLVTADLEYGPGMRLHGGVVPQWRLDLGGATSFPPPMAIGATGDERLAYEMGRVTALEGRAVGIRLSYAPIADVNNNPGNPVINTRSYGADPRRVAAFVAAHVRGLQDHGMLATAKHFPGHGDTNVDSHLDLPVITADRARADTVELVPFRAAIAAGVAAVMGGHIAFPKLTGDSVSATLSPAIMTELLGEELGFKGLVVTDALNMGAIVKRYGAGQAAVLAVKAGNDVLLMPPDVGAAIDAVVAAVERGEIPESRIDASVRKLLQVKADLGLHRERLVDLNRIPEVVGNPAHRALAAEAAERSITAVRDRQRLLPLGGAGRRRVLSVVYTANPDPLAGSVFQQTLASHLPGVRTMTLDARAASELSAVRAAANRADVVVFSLFVRVLPGAGTGTLAVPASVAGLISEVGARRPTVVVAFGNPYVLEQFPNIGTYVLAWGQEAASQRAAARALAGEVPITGKLPIDLPPFHARGEGLEIAGRRASAGAAQ